jgi:hypothetical protein
MSKSHAIPSQPVRGADPRFAERVSAGLAVHDIEQRLERAYALASSVQDCLAELKARAEKGETFDDFALARPLVLLEMLDDVLADREAVRKLRALAESLA